MSAFLIFILANRSSIFFLENKTFFLRMSSILCSSTFILFWLSRYSSSFSS